jgi:hypothetical protein
MNKRSPNLSIAQLPPMYAKVKNYSDLGTGRIMQVYVDDETGYVTALLFMQNFAGERSYVTAEARHLIPLKTLSHCSLVAHNTHDLIDLLAQVLNVLKLSSAIGIVDPTLIDTRSREMLDEMYGVDIIDMVKGTMEIVKAKETEHLNGPGKLIAVETREQCMERLSKIVANETGRTPEEENARAEQYAREQAEKRRAAEKTTAADSPSGFAAYMVDERGIHPVGVLDPGKDLHDFLNKLMGN